MNTLPEASGNAKQTHLQLNIHLTFGLEFEVSISFHVPGILYWDSCPDVSPLGCKGFVITVLCYILWRDWGPWRENCPVNCMKLWTPCPQALWGPSSTFTSSVFFSLRQYVRIQKSDTNNRVCDEKCQSSPLPSKPHSHPPKKLSCANFFLCGYLHNCRQYVYKMYFPVSRLYQFYTILDIYVRRKAGLWISWQ